MARGGTLELSDLYFGTIDAKNELRGDDPESRARFKEAFITPQNIAEQDFLDGTKFIVYGPKGTGKTALIRYIGLLAQEEGAEVRFVLFREHIAGQERQLMKQAANAVDVSTAGPTPEAEDYEEVWLWLFHRILADVLAKSARPSAIERDSNYDGYRRVVTIGAGEGNGLSRLLPSVKKGKLEVGAIGTVPKGSLDLEFEWVGKNRARVDFRDLLRAAGEAMSLLRPTEGEVYLMLDELELTLGQKTRYQRDVQMIRDLIVSAAKFNARCSQLHLPVHLLVAVRSEVLASVACSGKEINKIVEDFGSQITWNYPGDDPSHPLLQIVARRINSSEKRAGCKLTPPDNLWEKFFPAQVQQTPVRQYILHQTWYRPRDIVRLFGSICQAFPHDSAFSHAHFDTIRRDYSLKVWNESIEELRTTYSVEEIDGVKRMLTGYRPFFTLDELSERAQAMKPIYRNVETLLKKRLPGDILTDLYRVGVVGNDYLDHRSKFRQRWSFRGDSEPLLDKRVAVHRGLWAVLSLN